MRRCNGVESLAVIQKNYVLSGKIKIHKCCKCQSSGEWGLWCLFCALQEICPFTHKKTNRLSSLGLSWCQRDTNKNCKQNACLCFGLSSPVALDLSHHVGESQVNCQRRHTATPGPVRGALSVGPSSNTERKLKKRKRKKKCLTVATLACKG